MSTTPGNDQFRIVLPDGWEDRTVHCFMGPEDSGVQHMLHLMVDRNVDTDDVSEYARDRIDQIIETMPAAEILKEEEKTLPNGVPVYEAVYKWVPPNGKVTFQKLVYMIRDGVAYSFNANFSKKTLKTIGVEVDKIIESFEPNHAK
ncbi:MAG: DcrB-related protein [Candidatus Zixiibacteriota bacterium]